MRAAVLDDPRTALRVETILKPEPKAGEVLLQVRACGVCATDLHVIKGEVGFPTPCVLGHEVSGVVEAVGDGVVTCAPGDRVAAAFLMPCGFCRSCARGRDDLCETFFGLNRVRGTLYDGTTRLYRTDGTPLAMYSMGGLAEYAVVPATAVFPVPVGLDLEAAAVLGCAVLTAYGAVAHGAPVRPGDRVAVVAVGGIGQNIVQMARAFGAVQIIAVGRGQAKLDVAKQMGATDTVDSRATDPVERVRELTGDADERGNRVLRLADRDVDHGLAGRDVAQKLRQPHERRACVSRPSGGCRAFGDVHGPIAGGHAPPDHNHRRGQVKARLTIGGRAKTERFPSRYPKSHGRTPMGRSGASGDSIVHSVRPLIAHHSNGSISRCQCGRRGEQHAECRDRRSDRARGRRSRPASTGGR